MDLLGDDTDDHAMWSPLRGTHHHGSGGANDCSSETASAGGLSLWAEEEAGGGGGDGLDSSVAAVATTPRHLCPSSTANVIYSTTERGGAERASSPGFGGIDGGGWHGSNAGVMAEAGQGAAAVGAGEGRGVASAANLLEGEPDPAAGLSSLEPLA